MYVCRLFRDNGNCDKRGMRGRSHYQNNWRRDRSTIAKDNDISIAHPIPTYKVGAPPKLIVKFTRRSVRNRFYLNRRKLARKKAKDLPNLNLSSEADVFVSESLTTFKKKLFGDVNKVKSILSGSTSGHITVESLLGRMEISNPSHLTMQKIYTNLIWNIQIVHAAKKGPTRSSQSGVSLGVRTCELFLCFVAIVRVRAIVLTSMFSLFYVTGEFHRLLYRGRATKWSAEKKASIQYKSRQQKFTKKSTLQP